MMNDRNMNSNDHVESALANDTNSLNTGLTQLVRQWQVKKITGDSDALIRYICEEQADLSAGQRHSLAIALVADDYRSLRLAGAQVWISAMLDAYEPALEEAGLAVDRTLLLRQLIQVEFDTTRHRLNRDNMVSDFPEVKDFIDECFNIYKTTLFSRLGRQSDQSVLEQDQQFHTHGEEIAMSEIYQVDSLLGSGGQKDVYKVVQVSTGQTLALKELKTSHETQRAMMHNEAVLQSQLTHPNIPIVLSLNDSESNKPVFVERLVSGMSWADAMDTLSLSENMALLQTVSKVVAFAHQQRRIIHGDLKPENVVLGKNGNRYNEVYLVDWGLAVSLDDPELATRMPCGTTVYMPPESLGTTSHLVSPATDVFMLGGILYRILTGKAPYEDAYYLHGAIGVLNDIEKVLIPPIPSRNEQTQNYIPSELIEIANKALESDPANRFADAGAFAEALSLYQHRVVLTNRLLKADKTFEALRKRQELSKTVKSKLSFPIMELVENTNEFRLVRQELSVTGSNDALYNDAVKAERQARSLLLESALNTRDYSLTEAQLALGEELEKSLPKELASENDRAILAAFRLRLASGLAARRRDKLIKWLAAFAACAIIALFIWGLQAEVGRKKAEVDKVNAEVARNKAEVDRAKAEADKIIQEKENALLKLIPFEKDMAIAENEMFGQGTISVGGAIVKDNPHMSTYLEQVLHKALLPQAQSSFNVIANATAFSIDDQYAAVVLPTEIGLIDLRKWQNKQSQGDKAATDLADSMSIVFRPKMRFDSNGEDYVLANPYFTDITSKELKNSAPFIIVTAGGLWGFVHADPAEKLELTNLNNLNDRPEGLDFNLGRPVFVGQKDNLLMIVGDADGNMLFFSFPDGKLIKTVSAHKKSGNGAVRLVVSPDKQMLISSGEDGLVKQWKSDGTFVKTLALPFPDKPDSDFGFVRTVDFTPDGKRLFAGCENGTIVAWDLQTDKIIAQMAEKKEPDTYGAMIQRIYAVDNNKIMTFCLNNRYRIWDLTKRDSAGVPVSREFQNHEPGPKLAIRSVAVSPSRKYLLVSENVHAIKLCEMATGKLLARTEGVCKSANPSYTLSAVAYHQGGDKIIAGTLAYVPLCAYDPLTLRVTRQYFTYPRSSGDIETKALLPHSIAVPKLGKEFAVALGSGDVLFFDMADSSPKKILSKVWAPASKGDDVFILAASRKQSRLAGTSLLSDEIIVWNWKERKQERSWKKAPVPPATDTDFQATHKAKDLTLAMFFASEDDLYELKASGRLLHWNAATGKLLAEKTPYFQHASSGSVSNSDVSGYAISNDARSLAIGFRNGTIIVVGLPDCELQYIDTSLTRQFSNCALDDNHTDSLATQPGGTVLNPASAVTGIDWSHDDALMAVSFSSGKTVLVETKGYELLTAFLTGERKPDPKGALSVCPFFTKQGYLTTAGTNGVFRRWDFQPSPEKPKVLKTNYGADQLTAIQSAGSWAGTRDLASQRYGFFVYDKTEKVFQRDNIADFERLGMSNGVESFLLLDKNSQLSAVDAKGKTVSEPCTEVTLGKPPKGFVRFSLSPDRRWLAAIDQGTTPKLHSTFLPRGGSVYLLDRQNLKAGYVKVPAYKPGTGNSKEPQLFDFAQMAFSPDSKQLAVVSDNGELRFISTEQKRLARPINYERLVGPMVSMSQGAITYTKSGRFVVQVGASGVASVWDVEKNTLFQKIRIGLYDRIVRDNYSINGLAALDRGFGVGEDAQQDAFVLCGYDGILRFYQFNQTERRFIPIYVVSQLTIASFLNELPKEESDTKKTKDSTDVDETVKTPEQGKSKTELTELVEQYQQEEKEDDMSIFTGLLAQLTPKSSGREYFSLLPSYKYCINDLVLSDDGKTLYVGSSEEVHAYDMDAIRARVASLPTIWKNINVEQLTGLQYTQGKGFRYVNSNSLVPQK